MKNIQKYINFLLTVFPLNNLYYIGKQNARNASRGFTNFQK